MNTLAQLRLLQLASQAMPIGGYSHSHGLEAAIEAGIVRDEATAAEWITDVMRYSIDSYELPMLFDFFEAWIAPDVAALERLNREFLASRESAELRSASVQMGFSLRALLAVLPDLPPALLAALRGLEEPSLPCAWSGAASAWSIAPAEAAAAYLWSWAENQVLVALKAVPVGQSAGQRVLLLLGAEIARLARRWPDRAHAVRSNFAPGLAVLSARHETQYSRLFRS